jgi:hypothetical protein
MRLTALRQIAATSLLLAMSGCGGRASVDDGSATGGQSGALGSGGQPGAGDGATAAQAGAPAVTSGGSSSASPPCTELCESILCTGENVVTPPGQCCPVCAVPDAGTLPADDAGIAPPPVQCPGQPANPPTVCPLTPSDVICSKDTDCTMKTAPLCASCIEQVYGVNLASNSACEPIPCPAQAGTCTTFSFQTQDCQLTEKNAAVISARCVLGQCLSFALNTIPR